MKSFFLLSLTLASLPLRAQEMVEVPTAPARLRQLADERARTTLQPAPSPERPIPPPLVVAPPSLPPSRWRVERRFDLTILGGALFTGIYAVNLGVGLDLRVPAMDLPVVGPLVELARLGRFSPEGMGIYTALTLDALVQGAALTLAIASPFFKHMMWRPIAARR